MRGKFVHKLQGSKLPTVYVWKTRANHNALQSMNKNQLNIYYLNWQIPPKEGVISLLVITQRKSTTFH
jgi:hypothetical protein